MSLTRALVKLACRKYKSRDKKWASMIKAGAALDKKFRRVETLKGELRKLAKANPGMAKFAALPQYFPGAVQFAHGKK
jgi:hypothetical protein